MAADLLQRSREAWAIVRRQHGVIAREQLHDLGFTESGIRHRLDRGRIHELFPGVYAVGRPEVSREGRWMAAVLGCGPTAVLSHHTAAEAWGVLTRSGASIEISVSYSRCPSMNGLRVHRRTRLPESELTRHRGIPITSPALTMVDIATHLSRARLEAAVNEADRLELIDPETLRARLPALPRYPGVGVLRALLDRQTFRLTDSELERRFLRLVRSVDLPEPLTQQRLNGFRVDFHWPSLGLVVETDGLRYHRTPQQQAQDRRRDQAHARTGLTVLRFTHAQVRFERREVRETLRRVARHLSSAS
jgi:very-short-patch-repair endonuclease